MYPDGELTRLSYHKAALRRRIAIRREECAAAAAGATRPLAWLDRAIVWWKKVKPLTKVVAIPLTLLAKRLIFPRFRLFSSLLRWGPALFGAAKMAGAFRRQ